MATMLGVVALAALNILPIEISAVLGFMVLLLTRCLNWKDAMSALSTQVILIIVASLAMGAALLKTGGADYLDRELGAPARDWLRSERGFASIGEMLLLTAHTADDAVRPLAAHLGLAERDHEVRAGVATLVVHLTVEVLVLQEEHGVVTTDRRT